MSDVLDLLHAANPVPDTPAYPTQELQTRIAHAQTAGARPTGRHQGRRPRSKRRTLLVLGTATASLLALGLGTAAAAGWFSPDVREAFAGADDPSNAGPAHPDTVQEEVTAPGPEGTRMALWDELVGPRGACYSIIVDRRSAELVPGKPFHQGASCGSGRSRSLLGVVEESSWRSPTTGRLYWLYGGTVGTAAGFEIRIPGKTSLPAILSNGHFLTGPLPEADRAHAHLVPLDSQGHVIVVNGQQDGLFLGDSNAPG